MPTILMVKKPIGRIGSHAKILNCEVSDYFSIDSSSAVNRCNIGKYFGLGCFSYIADTSIGRYCTFASRVSIGPFNHPTNWLSVHEFQYRVLDNFYDKNNGNNLGSKINELDIDSIPTKIGSDVWIGDNVCIVRGVNIGNGAIIGMGSVVTKDVEPYSIVAGNPAKIIRYRFDEEIIDSLEKLMWWTLEIEDLRGVIFEDIQKSIEKIREIKK